MTYRVVRRVGDGQVVLPRARWCRSFWCRFRGLMLRRRLPEDEGLLFVFSRPSRSQTSIHMFFVNFPIAAVWMDAEGVVVDSVLARPWRPYYAPSQPAQYLIEAHPRLLEHIHIGDRLDFSEVVTS